MTTKVRSARAVTICACLVVTLQLLKSASCQGNSTELQLDSLLYTTQPTLFAPSNTTGSLRFSGSYSLLSTPGQTALKEDKSTNFTVAANSSLLIQSFTRISCATLRLTAGNDSVYGFFTKAGISQTNNSAGQLDLILRVDPLSLYGENYLASELSRNKTISQRLALGNTLINSSSGIVSVDTYFVDGTSLAIVNPTSEAANMRLEVSLNPLGPCQACHNERNAEGTLGNCGEEVFENATITTDDTTPPLEADTLFNLLIPGQSDLRDVGQGKAAVFTTFTNAACMLYTIRQSAPASNLDLNKALLSAWVSTSEEQQRIVATGEATSQQKSVMQCVYPFTTELKQPCFVYNDTLNPNETYYLWVENSDGGSQSYGGAVTVDFELMILNDPSDCSMSGFFNLSHSSFYLNAPSDLLPLIRNSSVTADLSPYDPGVTPLSFLGGTGNTFFNYPILGLSSDGSLSQIGNWNITLVGSAGDELTTQFSYSSAEQITLDVGGAILPYGSAGSFSNAACYSLSLNATGPVTSFLLPRATLQANYNYSASLPPRTGLLPAAYESSLSDSRSFRQQSAEMTVSNLMPNETYVSVVNGAVRNGTIVTLKTASHPPGSSSCQNSTGQSSANAPSPAGQRGVRAVRGVYDRQILQYGEGGADVMATVTGASCIAFSFSGRGVSVRGSGPTLFDSYYNVSVPGNSTDPEFSASAILLEGAAVSQSFAELGFQDSVNASGTISVTAGCKINSTSPGPCIAYANGLNSSELYFIWGVIGAKSPSSWVLLSFEALPSGSCNDLYTTAITPQGGSPPPTPTLTPMPSSSSTSVGVIVGPVVAVVAAVVAAIVLAVFLMRRRKRKLADPLNASKNAFVVSKMESRWDDTDSQYAYFKDVIGRDATHSATQPPNFFQKPDDTDSYVKLGSSANASEQSGKAGTTGSSSDVIGSLPIIPAPSTVAAPSEKSLKAPSSVGSAHPLLADQWEIDLADLKLKMVDGRPVKLGEGGFGAVYLGFWGVREVAVKIATGHSAVQREKFLHEILVLKGCRDPSIVQFLGASVAEGQLALVMEFMQGGDLHKAIAQDSDGAFLWHNNGCKLALDVAKGLYHLHSKNIVHMDLKTPNILLTANHDQAKISDVGLAKLISEAGTTATQGASFMWASPEQLLSGKCTAASDMFSFGVVLWEICTGEPPSRSRNYRDLLVPQDCPQAVADLVHKCLSSSPADRPTAQQAHSILTKCARVGKGRSF